MKITKEQLTQIIKEEIQSTLQEAEGMYGVMGQMPGQSNTGGRDLSKDNVLYNAVKTTYDEALGFESDNEEFVDYLESLKVEDMNDDKLDREIKDLIWGWLNNEDYFIKLGRVPSIALALAGIKKRAIRLMENKITKEQLTQIIKEEIHSLLEGRYRGPGYRYTEKGMATHARKAQQLKISNKMKEKGRADALAGNPKDENITHLAYSQAYDKAMEEKSNPMQEQ